jgi:DnaD/phage-associated family protein
MRDPAFLFYSSDFLTGCINLTFKERGQYITLLCTQHQKDHLDEKTIRLVLGYEDDDNKPINEILSPDVLSKFKRDEKGLYYNERLDIEIKKRLLFTESRRQNGQLGGRPPKNPDKLSEKASAKPNGYPYGKPNGEATNNLGENDNDYLNNNLFNKSLDLYSYIQINFGRTLSPVEYEKIDDWKKSFSEDIIKYAVCISVYNRVNNFAYVNKILNNWKFAGYKTLKDIKFDEEKRQITKNQKIEIPDYNWLEDHEEEQNDY